MDASKLILYMIMICVAFMILVILSKPLKHLVKFLIQGAFGILGISVANMLLASFHIAVGINFITFFVVGLLGFPGFICLYIVNAIIV